MVNEAAALQFVRVLLGLLSPSTPSPREIATAERRALHKLFAWVFLDYSPHGCLSALLESATSKQSQLLHKAAIFRAIGPHVLELWKQQLQTEDGGDDDDDDADSIEFLYVRHSPKLWHVWLALSADDQTTALLLLRCLSALLEPQLPHQLPPSPATDLYRMTYPEGFSNQSVRKLLEVAARYPDPVLRASALLAVSESEWCPHFDATCMQVLVERLEQETNEVVFTAALHVVQTLSCYCDSAQLRALLELFGPRLVATLIKHALPGTPGVPPLLGLCVEHIKNHYTDSLAPLVSLLPVELQQMIAAAREKGLMMARTDEELPEALVCLRTLTKSQPKVAIPMALGGIQHWLDHSGPWQYRVGGLRVLAIFQSFPYGGHLDLVAPHLAFVEECLYDPVVMVRRTSCDTAGMRAQQFPEPDTTVLKLAEQLADPAVCEAALVAIDRFLPLTQSSHGAIAQACQGVLRQPPQGRSFEQAISVVQRCHGLNEPQLHAVVDQLLESSVGTLSLREQGAVIGFFHFHRIQRVGERARAIARKCVEIVSSGSAPLVGDKSHERAHLLVRSLALLHEIVKEQAMTHLDWVPDGGESVLLLRLIELLSACADTPPIDGQRALLRFDFSPAGHPSDRVLSGVMAVLRLILERHRELVAAHLDELMPALLHVLEAHGAKRSRDLCVFVGALVTHLPTELRPRIKHLSYALASPCLLPRLNSVALERDWEGMLRLGLHHAGDVDYYLLRLLPAMRLNHFWATSQCEPAAVEGMANLMLALLRDYCASPEARSLQDRVSMVRALVYWLRSADQSYGMPNPTREPALTRLLDRATAALVALLDVVHDDDEHSTQELFQHLRKLDAHEQRQLKYAFNALLPEDHPCLVWREAHLAFW